MSAGENLKRERLERRLSQADLAQLAGVGHNTIGQIERGDTSPTLDTLEAVARAMGLQLSDLIGEKLAPANAELSVPLPFFEDIPIEGWAEGVDQDVPRTYYVQGHLASPDRITVRVRSDHMYPTLWPGDVALIDQSMKQPKSGSIVALELNGEYLARRLRRMRGKVQLSADNPQYPPVIVEPGDDFQIVGVLLAILHRDLTNLRFR